MNRWHHVPLNFGASDPSDYTEHAFDAEDREVFREAERERSEQEGEE